MKSVLAIQSGPLGGANIGDDSDPHSDVTSAKRADCAQDKSCGRGKVTEHPEQEENDGGYGADGYDLSIEVGLGPFLNRTGDLEHPLVSRRKGHHLFDEEDSSAQGREGRTKGQLPCLEKPEIQMTQGA